MAKIRKHFSSHSKLFKIIAIVFACFCISTIVLLCLGKCSEDLLLLNIGNNCFLVAFMAYALIGWYEIDDEKKTLTVSTDKKRPIDIMKIDRIALHTNKKGRIKYVTIHETGVGYSEVSTRPTINQDFMELLLKITPDIQSVTYDA